MCVGPLWLSCLMAECVRIECVADLMNIVEFLRIWKFVEFVVGHGRFLSVCKFQKVVAVAMCGLFWDLLNEQNVVQIVGSVLTSLQIAEDCWK